MAPTDQLVKESFVTSGLDGRLPLLVVVCTQGQVDGLHGCSTRGGWRWRKQGTRFVELLVLGIVDDVDFYISEPLSIDGEGRHERESMIIVAMQLALVDRQFAASVQRTDQFSKHRLLLLLSSLLALF